MTLPVAELVSKYPACEDFLTSYGLENIDRTVPFMKAVEEIFPEALSELGFSSLDLADLLQELLAADSYKSLNVRSITIYGGKDKDGKEENVRLTISQGEIISLVGPTGSGKSQLLADIECAARGDTPTCRHVCFDGEELADEDRFSMGNRLVAQLTQNMNFVIDVTVEAFLRMHARSRMQRETDEMIERCFETANALSGEAFEKSTKVTRLSGGQARALMIADAACISPSPILLIDEIENAGIDRLRAVELLRGGGKIVLLATHDPLLSLLASRRIVLSNGGIKAVLETSEEEKKALRQLTEADKVNTSLRNLLRKGERIEKHVGNVRQTD